MISYREGYKYQLAKPYELDTGIIPDRREVVTSRFIRLTRHGRLIVITGYAWDGSSCAVDTASSMEASLVHDALYQLMREGGLPEYCREPADQLYRTLCVQNGMYKIQAWWRYRALRRLGGGAAREGSVRAILEV